MDITISTCITACIAILAYGVALSKFLPRAYHWFSNSIFVLFLLLWSRLLGLSADQLGVGARYIASGILVALTLSIIFIAIALFVATVPRLQGYFLSQDSILKTKNSRIAFETMFRIPLVTALFEEFVFRGFLLALFLSIETTTSAILYSSIIFGLWHIFPAINGMNQDHYNALKNQSKHKKFAFVCFNVASTAVAGLFFSWLRIVANSVVAPWLLHSTINAGGVVAVLFANKRNSS